MKQFVQQAKHNEEFLSFIKQKSNSDFTDWQLTVIFYIAKHYINAYLSKCNLYIPKTHFTFNELLISSKSNVPSNVHYAYNTIMEYSRTARYQGAFSSDFSKLLLKQMSSDSEKQLIIIKKFVKQQGVF